MSLLNTLHDVISCQDKKQGGNDTTLAHARVHFEKVVLFVSLHLALISLIEYPGQLNKLGWYSIVPQDSPKCVSMYAVKGLPEVNEIDIEWNSLFFALLDNISESEDMVSTASTIAKTRLLLINDFRFFKGTDDSMMENLQKDFTHIW